MKPLVTMRGALDDPELLGGMLGGPSWAGWRVLLIAAMGEKLTPAERKVFTKLTGRAKEPGERIDEFFAIIGRRGGKTRAAAILSVYLAALCDYTGDLAVGERGLVLFLAQNAKNAAIALKYATAVFDAVPMLGSLVVNRTADTLSLSNSIDLEVRPASFTPYRKRGTVYEAYSRDYGADGDPRILVAHGSSRDLNSKLPQSVIDRALERDPAAASGEYLAQFRDDVSGWATRELIEAAVDRDVSARPSRSGVRYA
jgi:hypothetical protein